MLTAPPASSSPDLVRGSTPSFTLVRKTADQILTEAAARAEAAGDPVAAFKLRREAEQARLARARGMQ